MIFIQILILILCINLALCNSITLVVDNTMNVPEVDDGKFSMFTFPKVSMKGDGNIGEGVFTCNNANNILSTVTYNYIFSDYMCDGSSDIFISSFLGENILFKKINNISHPIYKSNTNTIVNAITNYKDIIFTTLDNNNEQHIWLNGGDI